MSIETKRHDTAYAAVHAECRVGWRTARLPRRAGRSATCWCVRDRHRWEHTLRHASRRRSGRMRVPRTRRPFGARVRRRGHGVGLRGRGRDGRRLPASRHGPDASHDRGREGGGQRTADLWAMNRLDDPVVRASSACSRPRPLRSAGRSGQRDGKRCDVPRRWPRVSFAPCKVIPRGAKRCCSRPVRRAFRRVVASRTACRAIESGGPWAEAVGHGLRQLRRRPWIDLPAGPGRPRPGRGFETVWVEPIGTGEPPVRGVLRVVAETCRPSDAQRAQRGASGRRRFSRWRGIATSRLRSQPASSLSRYPAGGLGQVGTEPRELDARRRERPDSFLEEGRGRVVGEPEVALFGRRTRLARPDPCPACSS